MHKRLKIPLCQSLNICREFRSGRALCWKFKLHLARNYALEFHSTAYVRRIKIGIFFNSRTVLIAFLI